MAAVIKKVEHNFSFYHHHRNHHRYHHRHHQQLVIIVMSTSDRNIIIISCLHSSSYIIGWALCQPGASAANGALLAASVYGHIPIVKYLLYKRNADINCTDGRKITPLLLASYKGRHELVEFMVNETDADVHFKCGEGKDCLDWAKKKSWSKVVAVLEQDVRRRKIEKTVERDLESVIMLKDCIIGACGFSSHKYNISS
mmetsp:Transcript_18653/g.29651  ORF Transcript_18653/g.29651 Transcript_18653/m.29651 type:complete len:199 (-) Transcript_18653:205-801(-)